MSEDRNRQKSALSLFNPPLLITESADAYRELRDAFVAKIGPRDIIEQIYVADFVDITWDIKRLWRCKTALINQAYFSALCEIIDECSDLRGEELRRLAASWFTDADARSRVLTMLAERKLDASAIEARAFWLRMADLEPLERMLAALESRRNRARQNIFDYRQELALQLERHSNDFIENTPQLRLQPPTAA